jgi:hypothetical protein
MIFKGKFIEDDVYREGLIKKWESILKIIPIPNEHWVDVAEYCEKYEHEKGGEIFPALPISLKIISKLDLSKVMFTDFNEMCRPVKIFLNVTRSQFNDIQDKIGIDLMMTMESALIEQMSLYLKQQIEDEGGLIISEYFNTILVDDPSDYKLELTGHILTFNVFRMKKLRRLKSIIDEKRKD